MSRAWGFRFDKPVVLTRIVHQSMAAPVDAHVLDLHTELWSRETAGGKGAALLVLAKAGFRVPPFVVIDAQCMR